MISATSPTNQWLEQSFWQMADSQMRYEIAFLRANDSAAPVDRDSIMQKILVAMLETCMPAGNA